MKMDKADYIRIAPKRGRLPRRYEIIDNRTAAQRWRVVCYLCLAAASLAGIVYLVLR